MCRLDLKRLIRNGCAFEQCTRNSNQVNFSCLSHLTHRCHFEHCSDRHHSWLFWTEAKVKINFLFNSSQKIKDIRKREKRHQKWMTIQRCNCTFTIWPVAWRQWWAKCCLADTSKEYGIRLSLFMGVNFSTAVQAYRVACRWVQEKINTLSISVV